jgi:hypothetical protein
MRRLQVNTANIGGHIEVGAWNPHTPCLRMGHLFSMAVKWGQPEDPYVFPMPTVESSNPRPRLAREVMDTLASSNSGAGS